MSSILGKALKAAAPAWLSWLFPSQSGANSSNSLELFLKESSASEKQLLPDNAVEFKEPRLENWINQASTLFLDIGVPSHVTLFIVGSNIPHRENGEQMMLTVHIERVGDQKLSVSFSDDESATCLPNLSVPHLLFVRGDALIRYIHETMAKLASCNPFPLPFAFEMTLKLGALNSDHVLRSPEISRLPMVWPLLLVPSQRWDPGSARRNPQRRI